ncbi:23S rRNA (adenine(1618)-N(6))-methyltransferase RlmF [Algoriphagus lacus]|uniref:Ribosomal RNA large subunit methyltransferase F n=1 Tax=Algoriphagus lacus TaxID=2056311 RepID=A0A418PVV3_9BACT|nr:23S rRNA (adenine(1618)-N(6))-methyltransferase RlmF [Algoriphagus lacus]RIW18310.1 23S rRNA (adenine(1618)-N(6))-methyltransferase RlmF [Algoriphagus lacus]
MKGKGNQAGLHARNIHQGRYDLDALANTLPELNTFLFTNEYGNLTLDFSDPTAVKALNRALLLHFYHLQFWDIPEGFLCPPIPGRADYIHYLADLLGDSHSGKIPAGLKIKVLDVGTGANLIYPILGNACYGWSFVGSELNPLAIASAEHIISKNPHFSGNIEIRAQTNPENIFSGIIQPNEFFDMTMCNPPFHESALAALEGSQRKVKNLTGKSSPKPELNFGGQAAELWTDGGELQFIRKMIQESLNFKSQVFWFTSLVSKSENLKPLQTQLEKSGAVAQKIIEMAQGNKKSRFIVWSFLNEKQRKTWSEHRWS